MALRRQPQTGEILGMVTICAITGSGLSAQSECDWLSADEIESPEPWVRGFTTARLQRILPERIPEHLGTMCFWEKTDKKLLNPDGKGESMLEKRGKMTETPHQRVAGSDWLWIYFSYLWILQPTGLTHSCVRRSLHFSRKKQPMDGATRRW